MVRKRRRIHLGVIGFLRPRPAPVRLPSGARPARTQRKKRVRCRLTRFEIGILLKLRAGSWENIKLRDFSLCRLKSVLTSRHCFLEIKIIRNGNGLDINPLHSTAVIVNKNNVGTFIKEFFKHTYFFFTYYFIRLYVLVTMNQPRK